MGLIKVHMVNFGIQIFIRLFLKWFACIKYDEIRKALSTAGNPFINLYVRRAYTLIYESFLKRTNVDTKHRVIKDRHVSVNMHHLGSLSWSIIFILKYTNMSKGGFLLSNELKSCRKICIFSSSFT
jgi:hypothetical protein